MRIFVAAAAAALLVVACGSSGTPAPASIAPVPSTSAGASSSASPMASGSASASLPAIPSASLAIPSGSLAIPSASTGIVLPSGATSWSGPGGAALTSILQALASQGASASMAAWTGDITGATLNGSTLVVATTLSSKTSDVTDMCNALSSVVFGGASAVGVNGFQIVGSGGQTLDSRTSASGTC